MWRHLVSRVRGLRVYSVAVRGTRRGLSNCLGRAVRRHLSAADERFGLRLSAGLVVSSVAAVAFVLLLLLVRAGWPPLRNLDAGTAAALNQFGTDHPELVKSAEVLSDVFDPNVFRVALTLIAVVYLIHGERHHATWLVVTVFGGAVLGLALKEIIGRARRCYRIRSQRRRGCRSRLAMPLGRRPAAACSC